MPEMAYHGIVAGYNHHGSRVYLVHAEYEHALRNAAGQPDATVAAAVAMAEVPAAVEKVPEEIPVEMAAGKATLPKLVKQLV